MRFERLFFNPGDSLIGACELTYPTEGPAIEGTEPAIGAPFRPLEFGHNNTPTIGFHPRFEDLIWADLRTEVTSFAPGLVDGEFHRGFPYSLRARVEKNYSSVHLPGFSLPLPEYFANADSAWFLADSKMSFP